MARDPICSTDLRRSFPLTSATTVQSVTRILRLKKAANIWHLAYSAHVATAYLRSLARKIGQPNVPVVGFAGDGAFGIAVNELTAIGRGEWPAVTQIVFRNYQWGAEKRNSTLWFDDNFVGTELDTQVSYAGIAQACGLKGVVARTMDELTEALHQAVKDQMENGITTLIEAMINQELGEPFRRDAMKKPVAVAGIDAADMRKQTAV
jgi:sulfoacetaldehyde acetyltransferase